jgi:hypothetical protein
LSKLIIFLLAGVILLPSITACSAAKDVEERKNLMMPKKSEMPPNSRYREQEKRKINKHKSVRSRNRSMF